MRSVNVFIRSLFDNTFATSPDSPKGKNGKKEKESVLVIREKES